MREDSPRTEPCVVSASSSWTPVSALGSIDAINQRGQQY